jgi:uncharacterized protein (DUF1800 family)
MAALLPVDLKLVDPVEAWKPWQPAKSEWSRKWIAHLYRRAAFGAKPEEIARALDDGLAKTLDRLLKGTPAAEVTALDLFDESAKHCKNADDLRSCWLRLMMETEHPLREKLTLFWHNHFATSIAKVRDWQMMLEQNQVLRKHALGNFRPFVLEMTKNPAMLLWLDSNQNNKGAPNENYARELMELFSLGVGNYSEKDIREAARAFTGWHTDCALRNESFQFNAVDHDDGIKTIFGKTGNWNGEDIIKFCCEQRACAVFLVGKLYTYLVSESPPPKGLLKPLEDRFRSSDYDIADLVKTMLGSRLFFSHHAEWKRVKWPVEFVLAASRSLLPEIMPPGRLVEPLSGMGQALFAPPNVKGWRTGTDWLNSATMLARNNFAEVMAFQEWWKSSNSETAVTVDAKLTATLQFGPPGVTKPEAEKVVAEPFPSLGAAKPKNAAEMVQWMSEQLFGEPLPGKYARKLEEFFREPPGEEPTPPPQNPAPVYGALSTPTLPGAVVPAGGTTTPPGYSSPGAYSAALPVPPTAGKTATLAPPPRVVKRPLVFNLNSTEFQARCREILHAMMCLPEYQLN